jgi:hypothetical protein
VFGTAPHNGQSFLPDGFYSVKRLISSMSYDLIFTPTVSPSFVDHERHKSHESDSNTNFLPLLFIAMSGPQTTDAVHYGQSKALRLVGISGD